MHWDHIFLQQKCAKVGGSLTKYLKLGWLENLGYMADIHIHICVYKYIHMCCGGVVQLLSRLTLCDPMNCSTPGFPVLHYLLEFAQTYVHWVSDSIQPSYPLLPPFPALSLSQNQGLFQWVSSLHHVAKVLEFQLPHKSFQWIFKMWSTGEGNGKPLQYSCLENPMNSLIGYL